MQGMNEIEQQLMQEWENSPLNNACERMVSHPETSVLARVTLLADRHGNPKLRYWFGQSRVDCSTFATLTCPETRCPKRLALLNQWKVKAMGERPARSPKPVDTGTRESTLAREVVIEIDGMSYMAREAVFTLNLKCPQQAHSTVQVRLTGWDLFSPTGNCLAGGWDGEKPHLQTLDDVKSWLMQHLAELA